jgi:hypothetical protein
MHFLNSLLTSLLGFLESWQWQIPSPPFLSCGSFKFCCVVVAHSILVAWKLPATASAILGSLGERNVQHSSGLLHILLTALSHHWALAAILPVFNGNNVDC